MYDITDKDSFEAISTHWHSSVHENVEQDAIFMIIGNKKDKESSRVVSTHDGQQLATKLNAQFYVNLFYFFPIFSYSYLSDFYNLSNISVL